MGWFGGCFSVNVVILVTRWGGGFERRWFVCDWIFHADMLTLFGSDDSVNSQSKVEGATRKTTWGRL